MCALRQQARPGPKARGRGLSALTGTQGSVAQWAKRAVGIPDAMPRRGEVGVDTWWWIPIGLVAWFAVATAAGLLLGRVLKSCSRAREAQDLHTAKILALPRKPPPKHWRQAS
jgi:hypothetical protein